MRILHTSDWHLGRDFGPVALLPDQAAFLDWLVDECQRQKVELVAIAGDLYDRAIPSTDAIELFERTVQRLCALDIHVAAITGNHDSAVRVTVYDALLDPHLTLRGGYDEPGSVITLRCSDGPLDLVLLPYLDPQSAPSNFGVADDEAPADAEAAGTERRRRRTHENVLRTAADTARSALHSARSLALAHAYVAGGTESESERQLTVGGTSLVPADVFSGFSYTALGHLHRPQSITPTIRYSGTPLAYSFSEDHAKSVTIVDMSPTGQVTVHEEPIPVGRAVATIEGTLDDLQRNPQFDHAEHKFVRATLTNTEVVLNPRAALEARFPHLVELSQAAINAAVSAAGAEVRAERSPFELVVDFWVASTNQAPTADELEALRQSIERVSEVAQ